ncbi:hypothetical protein DL546_007661 [Coniochaeta pulveracea]|uniref:Uncharacterized protein n=1 Tax=Coniochaeta pulveracea TaxID=177199 RepID=A0A420YK87_9PEZI|nr:hypothetical protein DL546_007661 [Coniochaeta pulveracea]
MCKVYYQHYTRCGHTEEPQLVACARRKADGTCPAGVTDVYNNIASYCSHCCQ